jgi:hypothetical protein
MKHAASRELYAYWQEKRGTRAAPERMEIEPGAIRSVLADAFVLTFDGKAGYPIRLAGTRLCALFGREIKGESFLELWASTNRPTLEGLLSILSDECIGTVAGASAQNAGGETLDLELLLLPGTAENPALAGREAARTGHDRRSPSRRCGHRKTALAPLCGPAKPARVSGLRRRPRLRCGARRGRPERRLEHVPEKHDLGP